MRTRRAIGKKSVILLVVFLAAVAFYFLRPAGGKTRTDAAVYTAMEAATLPVVYPQMLEREMAPLYGHTGEETVSERDSLLLLPEDRKLSVRIDGAQSITDLRYEIRSLDGENLVERTELTDWETGAEEIRVSLPIQNLLTGGIQYMLGINAVLADGRSVWYYSRIIETDGAHVSEMLALAEEFSAKTFDYGAAQDLTMYMESSPDSDNNSYGTVTLKNSFSQITWGSLEVKREGTPSMRLLELSGELANVELTYEVTRTEGDTAERFAVTENFTMKWASQRIYMMDYEREMNQYFTGGEELYSGKRILLGINSGKDLYAKKNAAGDTTAFVVNGELWVYDSRKTGVSDGLFSGSDHRSILVFSFGAGYESDLRARHDDHGIEILEVEENGGVHFLVYGYMNRGSHEGETGIAGYYYDAAENTLEEQFFVPSTEGYEELKYDLERLAHKGANGVLYFYMGESVYGIDLTSHESVVVASSLTDDKFAVSVGGTRLAWQEGEAVYDSEAISVLDLDTGDKRQLVGAKGEVCRLIGFVGEDCVYGVGDKGDFLLSNGRTMGIYLTRLEIVDRQMAVVKSYEKTDTKIRRAWIEDSRIHIENTKDSGDGFFDPAESDTLVCNEEALPGRTDDIGWYASEDKGRVYFVQLKSQIASGTRIRTISPERLLVDNTEKLSLSAIPTAASASFYAYGRGRFLGRFVHFSDAAEAAYDRMGFVCFGRDEIVWTRGGKPNSGYIRDYQAAIRRLTRNESEAAGTGYTDEGSLMLELTGSSLNQVLYFVGNGMPVAAYTGEGQCVYLTGYDRQTVRVWDPESASSETWGLEETAAYFEKYWNDFLCLSQTED